MHVTQGQTAGGKFYCDVLFGTDNLNCGAMAIDPSNMPVRSALKTRAFLAHNNTFIPPPPVAGSLFPHKSQTVLDGLTEQDVPRVAGALGVVHAAPVDYFE